VALFLAPLPFLNIPFYHFCKGGYFDCSLKLSLLAARRVDRDLREEAVVRGQSAAIRREAAAAAASSLSTHLTPTTTTTSPTTTTTTANGRGVDESKMSSPSLSVAPAVKRVVSPTPSDWRIAENSGVVEEEDDLIPPGSNPIIVDYFELR